MAGVFPGSVRSFTAKTDLVDPVLAEHVNSLQDEVAAVESALGTALLTSTWAGTYATPAGHASLSARLTNIEAGLTSLGTSKANVSGNVATASKWQTARTLTLDGVVTGAISFDGSANVTLTTTAASLAPLASPTFTGSPTAPTQTAGDATTKLATTAFVGSAITTHSAATTSVHGIANTALLVVTSDSRLSDQRTPLDGSVGTNKISDAAVTAAKLAVGAAAPSALTINAQTGTTYTLVISDRDKWVTLNNAAAVALTVPANVFSAGHQVHLAQLGSGQVTVTAGSGLTIRSAIGTKLRTANAAASLLFISATEVLLTGDLSV